MSREGASVNGKMLELDTKGICFLCKTLCRLEYTDSIDNGPISVIAGLDKLLRYLEVNTRQLTNCSLQAVDNMGEDEDITVNANEDVDVKVTMCHSCSLVIKDFDQVYNQRGLTSPQLDTCVWSVHKLIKNADENSNLVEKCKEHMKFGQPTLKFHACFAACLKNEIYNKCEVKLECARRAAVQNRATIIPPSAPSTSRVSSNVPNANSDANVNLTSNDNLGTSNNFSNNVVNDTPTSSRSLSIKPFQVTKQKRKDSSFNFVRGSSQSQFQMTSPISDNSSEDIEVSNSSSNDGSGAHDVSIGNIVTGGKDPKSADINERAETPQPLLERMGPAFSSNRGIISSSGPGVNFASISNYSDSYHREKNRLIMMKIRKDNTNLHQDSSLNVEGTSAPGGIRTHSLPSVGGRGRGRRGPKGKRGVPETVSFRWCHLCEDNVHRSGFSQHLRVDHPEFFIRNYYPLNRTEECTNALCNTTFEFLFARREDSNNGFKCPYCKESIKSKRNWFYHIVCRHGSLFAEQMRSNAQPHSPGQKSRIDLEPAAASSGGAGVSGSGARFMGFKRAHAQCDLCGDSFSSRVQLFQHKRGDMGSCFECGYIASCCRLKVHQKSVHTVAMVMKEIPGRSEAEVTSAVDKIKANIPTGDNKCGRCGQVFWSLQVLMTHFLAVHFAELVEQIKWDLASRVEGGGVEDAE